MRHSSDHTLLLSAGGALLIYSILACATPRPKRDASGQLTHKNNTMQRDTHGATSFKTSPKKTTAEPNPKEEAARLRCAKDHAESCMELAQVLMHHNTPSEESSSRAIRAYLRACELDRADACYAYGLMHWMGEGTEPVAAEISFGFSRAAELGFAHAKVDHTQILAPGKSKEHPTPETLFHYREACALGIQQACDTFANSMRGQNIVLPTPLHADHTTPSTTKTPVKTPSTRKAPSQRSVHAPLALIADRGLEVSGALDMMSVLKTIEPRRSQLVFCYEKSLLKTPTLAGALSIRIDIDATGLTQKVDFGSGGMTDKDLRSCVAQVVQIWRFAPSPEGPSSALYSLEFGVK